VDELWKAGERIEGRWEVHRTLKGGMGVVYVVYDEALDEVFAAKTFQDEVFARNRAISDRFLQEAETWINLDLHENITQARMVESIGGKPYLFLEFVSGGDLSSWIDTPRLVDDLPQVLRLGLQFCDGMQHALSKGVKAHRDIKPQNCLITDNGTLKVTDFGLAKLATDVDTPAFEVRHGGGLPSGFEGMNPIAGSNTPRAGFFGRLFSSRAPSPQPLLASLDLSKTGTAAGTCTHMAPEQFDDSKHVDVRSDLYSFGIMLYQMTSGKLPFVGRTWQDYERLHKSQTPPLLHGASDCLNDLIQSCLAKVPAQRPAGFDRVRDRLAELYETRTGRKPLSPRTGQQLDAVDYFNKGGSFGKLSKFGKALIAYDQCLEISHPEEPVFEQALVNRGIALFHMQRFDEALSCYNSALKLSPNDAKAWFNKGSVSLDRNDLYEAERCYRQAVANNARFDSAHCNLGVVLQRLGRLDEAIECLDRAVALNPKDAANWMNKGLCLRDMDRIQEALPCFDTAIQVEPRNPLLWFNKGVVFGQLGEADRELACYDRALGLDQRDIQSWVNKGVVLVQQGKIEAAVECYDHALNVDPTFVTALQNKGAALLIGARQSEALVCFDRALGLDQELAGAWLLKGRALLEIGRVEEALSSYEAAERLGRQNASEGIDKCRRLLSARQGQTPPSITRDLDSTATSQNPSGYYNMAIRSIQQGDRNAAVGYYSKALSLLGEETSNSRVFKALISYQCGVCVLKLSEMEDFDPKQFSMQQRDAKGMIRHLWGSTLRLYDTLSTEDLRSGFGALLPKAIQNINKDPIMAHMTNTDRGL
jgi:tetratricopeptide (TPR) repeat protein